MGQPTPARQQALHLAVQLAVGSMRAAGERIPAHEWDNMMSALPEVTRRLEAILTEPGPPDTSTFVDITPDPHLAAKAY